jgi:hypothetical protein
LGLHVSDRVFWYEQTQLPLDACRVNIIVPAEDQ